MSATALAGLRVLEFTHTVMGPTAGLIFAELGADVIKVALQEVLGKLPQDEAAHRCERAQVSWAPVAQPGDLFDDPHLLATGGLVEVILSRYGGADGTRALLPALPVEFGADRQRPGLVCQPPRVGEHNAAVLGEAGFSPGEIAALAESGVITA